MVASHVHDLALATRMAAYDGLFGGAPVQVFPYADFTRPDDDIQIDVLVYSLRESGRDYSAMVTNGFSDGGNPRRELIQYFQHGRRSDAHRLQSAAQAAVEMGRWLDIGSAITLPYPSGSAWPHTIFLPPPLREHSEFEVEIAGGPAKLLWHVPLSDTEFAYQREHGIPVLLRGMSNAGLPWIFDETTRPVLR
jgi:hypothetical protein